MKKNLKIIAIVVAVIVVIAIAIPLFVNVNSFRPMIESRLSSALGRKVEVGNLSLSVFTGSLRANNITIADDPAFSGSPFVKAESFRVGVEVLPLIMSKALHITSLTLEKPQVTLLSSRDGKWNFSSLSTGAKDSSKESGAKDSSKNSGTEEKGASGESLTITKLRIKDGRLLMGTVGGKQHAYENVNLEASNVAFNSVIPFVMDATTPGKGKVHLEGNAGPVDASDASLTPLGATAKVSGFDLLKTGFMPADSGLAGTLDYAGKVKSAGGVLDSDGVITLHGLKLVKSGAAAPKPIVVEYATIYNMMKRTGTLKRGVAKTGKSALELTGDYDNRGTDMVLHMLLSGNSLPVGDIESLLPTFGITLPSGASLQGGTLATRLSIDGPVDKLVIEGPVDIANTKLVGFNLGAKMAAISALTGVQTGKDTVIERLSSKLRIAPEGIRADQMNLIVKGIGTMTGNGVIGPDKSLNFHMLAKLAESSGGGGLLGTLAPGVTNIMSKNGIAFAIQGNTSDPKFIPDVASAATGIAGGVIGGTTQQQPSGKPGLGEVLGGLFGKKKTK